MREEQQENSWKEFPTRAEVVFFILHYKKKKKENKQIEQNRNS